MINLFINRIPERKTSGLKLKFKAFPLVAAAMAALSCSSAFATQYVSFSSSPGAFTIAKKGDVAPVCVDGADWKGVGLAAASLGRDIESVSGSYPATRHEISRGSSPIIIGSIGHSALIDQLIKNRKIDVTPIKNKWESFLIQVVDHPVSGVDKALVIVGSDKRGTIYGVYDLSAQMGVSPWQWLADARPEHRSEIFVKPIRYVQGEPAVKYRGIFINDEQPSLGGWVAKNYGGFNSKFYTHIFELLLRLKANYLWPAMWGQSFNVEDAKNPILADEYGIVMGTSHQEPMMRSDAEIFHDIRSHGEYDYSVNRDAIYKFWQGGAERGKTFENIYTMGMRGTADTAINAKPDQIITLLQQVVADQRTILSKTVNPDLTKVPQMWCLYKEVQDYYDKDGLRVPDDITLLWSDDNNGNLRRLPTPDERKRTGGAGIYYHLDYVGAPRDYKWTCTVPLEKIWQQMNLAYAYDARKIWIVNVGSIKQKELPIDFFMKYAWNPQSLPKEKIGEFTRSWARQQFGEKYGDRAAEILSGYLRLNGMRKPEQMSQQPYSVANYEEADQLCSRWQALTDKAQALYDELPDDKKDSFYELALYPAKASSVVAQMYVAASKNKLYAEQKRASANDQADNVEALFKEDAALSDYYNNDLAGGKWKPFMAQVHIGYTTWADPETNIIPKTVRLDVPTASEMGVAVENSSDAWPGATSEPSLPVFDAYNKQTYHIDIFNRGATPFHYTAAPSDPWIVVDAPSGTVDKDLRASVSIDWSKAPAGKSSGFVVASRPEGETVKVGVSIDNTRLPKLASGCFVEKQGYVSIEAAHYSANIAAPLAKWEEIPNYGRTLSSMTPFPVNAPSLTNASKAPCLVYDLYLASAGEAKVNLVAAPSLNYVVGRGIRFAVAFDGGAPQTIDLLTSDPQRNWGDAVINNCRVASAHLKIDQPGRHTLKVWMVDPGFVLQKIVVDFGGVKPSYLAPPESYRAPK